MLPAIMPTAHPAILPKRPQSTPRAAKAVTAPYTEIHGAIISPINVVNGTQHGLTFGVVNYAWRMESGVQVGLINYVRDNPSGRRLLPIVNWGAR